MTRLTNHDHLEQALRSIQYAGDQYDRSNVTEAHFELEYARTEALIDIAFTIRDIEAHLQKMR